MVTDTARIWKICLIVIMLLSTFRHSRCIAHYCVTNRYGLMHLKPNIALKGNGYTTSRLVLKRNVEGDHEIIDVKVVNDSDDNGSKDPNKRKEIKSNLVSPLGFVADAAKSIVSKVTGFFKKKEKDPIEKAMDQAYEQMDKAMGSRNPFVNPLGTVARSVLKPMMRQFGRVMKEAAAQSAVEEATFSHTQRETLRLILRNEQCRDLLGLGKDQGNDMQNMIYYDKNGNEIAFEQESISSQNDLFDSSSSEWESSPPFSISKSHMNINGMTAQRISLAYQLMRHLPTSSLSTVAMVEVVANVKASNAGRSNQPHVSIEQCVVLFPSSNRTIRVR